MALALETELQAQPSGPIRDSMARMAVSWRGLSLNAAWQEQWTAEFPSAAV